MLTNSLRVQCRLLTLKMSNFPSIEEFDSGQVTATRLEDGKQDNMGFLDSAESDFLAREQAFLGDDAEFFQSTNIPSQQAAFFGANQGTNLLEVERGLMIQMKMYMNLRQVFLLLTLRFVSPTQRD